MRSSMASRRNSSRLSARLAISYVFDWVIIIAAAGIGSALSLIPPNKRPFSLGNPEISFPHKEDTVSSTVLILVSLLAPAVIIIIVCLLLVPGPTVPKSVPKNLIWKRKLWEWFTGWLGLGMSCAGAWFITSGLKNLVGKPRPDLLSRCQPDLANFSKYVLTGFPTTPLESALVSSAICQQADAGILDDGWRSWPSGHSSFSAAGLIYLSLFLASKFSLTIPFLSPRAESQSASSFTSAFPSRSSTLASTPNSTFTSKLNPPNAAARKVATNLNQRQIAARNQSASPPIYLFALAFIPTGAAMYIAASRFSDFRHHGFDILSGSFIGLVNAFWAFRYYHLPIARGAGWSWGPRSRTRAFWAGVGTGGYAEDDAPRTHDVENADAVMLDDLEGGPSESHDHVHGGMDQERDTVGGHQAFQDAPSRR